MTALRLGGKVVAEEEAAAVVVVGIAPAITVDSPGT